MSPAQREACWREFDRDRRRDEARMARFVHRLGEAGSYLVDGHRSLRAYGQAACNWSGAEADRFTKLGKLLARSSAVAHAAERGDLGVAQMHALAKLAANPRVSDFFDDAIGMLVQQACTLDLDQFLIALATWQSLADQDGTHDRHERAHRNRRARIMLTGHEFFLDANGANAQGVQLKAILDAFAQAEWLADWEAGVALHGQEMCPGLLERTDPQRRLDALVAIFNKAAEVVGGNAAGGFVVNLVMGADRFAHHLEHALGGHPEALDPNDPMNRCETTDGVQLDPLDVIVAAAMGHVRRVVLDSSGVVVDVGRKQRLFTGALRDAVMLSSPWCFWPGCHWPSSQCQADHVLPWANAGPTAAHNGGPGCAHHNRWRTRGYRTWRDPVGNWHHYRPDGSEIGWRADLGIIELQPVGARRTPHHNPAA